MKEISSLIQKPEMGKRLSKTFEKRLVGDYSFAPQVGKEEAQEALAWAKEFLGDVEDYLSKET
ncbi:MAG: hypothetical protein Q8O10_03275 [candidate division Zixibacteria bacterium]|nr:hypothetical protein [candidate division Zixibacteria bacterium]